MVTKGIIKSIDYSGNTCEVRLPLFENASQPSEVCIHAIFSIQPGTINGYKEGDVVVVAFDGNSISNPVVIGKLYLGANAESKDNRGTFRCDSLNVASNAILPLTTKLTMGEGDEHAVNVEGNAQSYKSLLDIVKALKQAEDNIDTNSRELLDLDAQVSTVEVRYLQAELSVTPTAETEGWDIKMPEWQDNMRIWQKTTYLNRRGQILGNPEIICLSTLGVTPTRQLRFSQKIHFGKQQKTNFVVAATAIIGTESETADSSTVLGYHWEGTSTYIPASQNRKNKLEIEVEKFEDKDLYIGAFRPAEEKPYAEEIIPFVPQNTPILDLSSDSASLVYINKTEKADYTEFVESTATVYYNGEAVPLPEDAFMWILSGCAAVDSAGQPESETSPKGKTIRIWLIGAGENQNNTATATCQVTYNGVTLKKTFTITKQLQGEAAVVQQAYMWSSDYTKIAETPDSKFGDGGIVYNPGDYRVSLKNWAENTWYIYEKPIILSDESSWDEINSNSKILFMSKRVATKNQLYDTPWEAPTVFAIRNAKAYQILKTADGLFGYGQGIYYTPVSNYTVLKPNSAVEYYKIGDQIPEAEAIAWVAAKPNERKDKIKLYINAEYIKAGAFTVKDGDDILFQAGLDSSNNNEPVVKIAGFDVSPSRMINIGDSGSGVGIAPESGHGCWAMWAGKQSGNGKETAAGGTPYGHDAPFRVGHDGALYSTSGNIGGFQIDTNTIKAIGTADNENTPTVTLASTDQVATVGEVERSDLRLVLGNNFGVSNIGNLYAQGGQIGALRITPKNLETDCIEINDKGFHVKRSGISIEDKKTPYASEAFFTINASGNAQLRADSEFFRIGDGVAGAEEANDEDITVGFSMRRPTAQRAKATVTARASIDKSNKKITVTFYSKVTELTEFPANAYLYITIGYKQTWSINKYVTYDKTITIPKGHRFNESLVYYFDESKCDRIAERGASLENAGTYYNKELIVYGTIEEGSRGTIFVYGTLFPESSNSALGASTGDGRWQYAFINNLSYTNATQDSSLNVKNSIKLIKDDSRYSEFFDRLTPITYKYNEGTSGRTHMGFIAQEVKESLEASGFTTQDIAAYVAEDQGNGDAIGLRYTEFIALNTNEIQKLKQRVAEQEKIIENLETRLKSLETK